MTARLSLAAVAVVFLSVATTGDAAAQTPLLAFASAKTCSEFKAVRTKWPQSEAAAKAKAKMAQMGCRDTAEATASAQKPTPSAKRTIFALTPELAAQFHAALMSLDAPAIRQMLDAGYDPNWIVGNEKNAALHDVMMVCERYPNHNPDALVIVVRMLVNAGGNVRAANIYGDTPLTIASSPRYCGPTHPVLALLR